jgi:hypothetical protein
MKPTSDDPQDIKEQYIKSKYKEDLYRESGSKTSSPRSGELKRSMNLF